MLIPRKYIYGLKRRINLLLITEKMTYVIDQQKFFTCTYFLSCKEKEKEKKGKTHNQFKKPKK